MEGVSVDVVIATGDAPAAILAAAQEAGADLIVLGPHRRGLRDMFVGTTAERTMRTSDRPVLTANAVPSGAYARVLLALDFDEASHAAARAIGGLKLSPEAEVVALHLFAAPALGSIKRAMETDAAMDGYVASRRQDAAERLAHLLTQADLDTARPLLEPEHGSPSAAILSAAERQGADLIVMGTHQRSGVQRFLIGSVARDVVLESGVDVLVVPPGE